MRMVCCVQNSAHGAEGWWAQWLEWGKVAVVRILVRGGAGLGTLALTFIPADSEAGEPGPALRPHPSPGAGEEDLFTSKGQQQ